MKTEIKYAPDSLNQVIYPNVSVQRRIAAYAAGQLEGHVMLYGTNGTGKTTVAKLLVQAIGGADALLEDKDIDELLGMPKFKDYMKNICSVARLTASGKYFMVLNEFDKTKKEVSKFWTALDACGEHVMVIITTNHAMEIDRAIRSRFDMIEMSGISAVQAIHRVQYALKAEGLSLPYAQVLHYLKQVENLMDFRKYFKKADELLFLHSTGLPFPPWKAEAPIFKII